MGFTNPFPQKKKVMVTEELNGQKDWTQLLYRRIGYANGSPIAVSGGGMGRFAADALLEIPEGCVMIEEGTLAEAWFFR